MRYVLAQLARSTSTNSSSRRIVPTDFCHGNVHNLVGNSAPASSFFRTSVHGQRRYSNFPDKPFPTTAERDLQPNARNEPYSEGETAYSHAPLSRLPLRMVLRSLGTSAVSSSPLLPLSLHIMAIIAYSTNPLLNPDRNPLLRFVLDKTLYAQFCAGGNASEVRETIRQLRRIGLSGVILAYAKESPSGSPVESHERSNPGEETPSIIEKEIDPWAESTLDTVRLTPSGDFAAFKFTGAGQLALHQLSNGLPPSPHLSKSIDDICQLAADRGVRLLFDGEQDKLQHGIDNWTIQFARKYNTTPGRATIFGTYQAYKKSTPQLLSDHLAQAQRDDFTLGVKLVRGAYLESDPRELIFDSKADTDACYDDSAASILTREWTSPLKGAGDFPNVSLMLATHNNKSVQRAHAICNAGRDKSEVFFAQLQGMADEISCELIDENQYAQGYSVTPATESALPVYKYMAWGTTGECMRYLLRRAEENKDAVERTREDRDAMWGELLRRIKRTLGRG